VDVPEQKNGKGWKKGEISDRIDVSIELFEELPDRKEKPLNKGIKSR